MVKMIKKKAKAIDKPKARPIVKLGASTVRYSKTHWVTSLSDAQKFVIATTTDMPHTFKGLPLSKGNAEALELYKRFSEDFHINAKRQQELMQKAQNNLEAKSKEQTELITKQLMNYQLQYKAEAKKQAEITRERLRILNKRADEVRGQAETQTTEHYRKKIIEAQIAMNKAKMEKEYQYLGRKLRMEGGIASLPIAKKFATQIFPRLQANKLAVEINKERKVKVGNGLNQLMTDNKLKKPLDIADAYLKATSRPDFYIVDSMDNHVALAEATGISPQRLFEMVCVELKGSKKKYEKYALERNAIGIEDLINSYDGKVASNNGKKNAIKYTKKKFYTSQDRKDWSELYSYHWKDYKRFNEDFNRWEKIFKSRATKRENLDADKFKDWVKDK
jgi:hypothetical protein